MTAATKWFDSLPPYDDWPNNYGVTKPLTFESDQWCARHWAPCPVLGYNGIGMAVTIQKYYLEHIKPPNLHAPEALNRHMHSIGRLCCTIGDEKMYSMWQDWNLKEEESE